MTVRTIARCDVLITTLWTSLIFPAFALRVDIILIEKKIKNEAGKLRSGSLRQRE